MLKGLIFGQSDRRRRGSSKERALFLCNTLQLSLYWEGDLRNLSYFMRKEKNESLTLKSCRPSIFGERKSAPNNRITEKLTVLKRKCRTIFRLKTL